MVKIPSDLWSRWNRIYRKTAGTPASTPHPHPAEYPTEFANIDSEELRLFWYLNLMWYLKEGHLPLLGHDQQAEHVQTGKCFLLYVQTSFLSFSSLPFLLIRDSLLGSSRFQYFWQFKIPQCCRLTPPHVESIDFVIPQSPGQPT